MRAVAETSIPPFTGWQLKSARPAAARHARCVEQPGKRELALADDADVGVEVLEDRRRHDGEAGAAEHDRRVRRSRTHDTSAR